MSALSLNGANLGNSLQDILMAQDILPGDGPSYQLCKTLYSFHPLGAKLADQPISIAQSQSRRISVPEGPEDRLVEAFEREWKAIGADKHIFNCARLARVYGITTLALLTENVSPADPINFEGLSDASIGVNVFDPLNTAGSLVLNQDPNAIDFQKVIGISVQGQNYHRSRTVTLQNGDPLYIEYTSSAFGYVGQSIYQRALYQMKSFISTMVTDNLVAVKAGVLVAKTKQASSVIDRMMAQVGAIKRAFVKEAQTNNVIQIDVDECIESLDLHNLDGAFGMARKNIIENIASAAATPAKLLLNDTFAEGFGEGSEDAKHVAQYIDRIRIWMDPLYDFFDRVVRYRAWNKEFYATIQKDFPDEYEGKPYTTAFYEWSNSFAAEWPSLLAEPPSELVKVDETKLKAVIEMLKALLPDMDPENRVLLIQWAADNFNALKLLFPNPLVLDYDALLNYNPARTGEGDEDLGGEGDQGTEETLGWGDSAPRIALLPARPAR